MSVDLDKMLNGATVEAPELLRRTLANHQTIGETRSQHPTIRTEKLSVEYSGEQALSNINLDLGHKEVLAMVGPSGCGKSTFIRCLNRMNDTVLGCDVQGEITLDQQSIYALEKEALRARVGMVFQKPNPFPKSIYDNIAYGPKLHGLVDSKAELDAVVEASLRKAGLWGEVSNRLQSPATGLSGGQQQRLCIARTISISPEVILMDEPCSALDPIATSVIEDLILELKENFTIGMVTHSMQQARRIADRTAYFHLGQLVEVNPTGQIFEQPQHALTRGYLGGRFG